VLSLPQPRLCITFARPEAKFFLTRSPQLCPARGVRSCFCATGLSAGGFKKVFPRRTRVAPSAF
jgi:hypothetical protein